MTESKKTRSKSIRIFFLFIITLLICNSTYAQQATKSPDGYFKKAPVIPVGLDAYRMMKQKK